MNFKGIDDEKLTSVKEFEQSILKEEKQGEQRFVIVVFQVQTLKTTMRLLYLLIPSNTAIYAISFLLIITATKICVGAESPSRLIGNGNN